MKSDTYRLVRMDLSTDDLPPQTIQSRTLDKGPGVQPILFKFAPGESLTEHTSSYAAILIFLSGRAQITLGPDRHDVEAGCWVHMPANLPHSITAETPVVMLLEMLK